MKLAVLISILLLSAVLSACQAQQHQAASSHTEEARVSQASAKAAQNTPEAVAPTEALIRSLRLPPGFALNVFAQGLGHARMLETHPNGTIYVSRPNTDDIVALKDTDGDGTADQHKVVASGLHKVHGMDVQGNTIYMAGERRVYAAKIQANGDLTPPQIIADNLPPGGRHPYRTIGMGPDGWLYISIGSTCNACAEEIPESASIVRLRPNGQGRQVFASGLRNTIGFDWHPQTRELWGMDIGSDWLGGDIPYEELNNLTKGGDFGWPWCFGNRQADQKIEEKPKALPQNEYCSQTRPSVLNYQAHSSPIGFVFYTGDQFPKDYEGDAFIAMRGSWNREPAVGFKISRLDFRDGKPIGFHDFVTGFLLNGGKSQFGRLAGVTVARDGALLFSDDANGIIYRVTYRKPATHP